MRRLALIAVAASLLVGCGEDRTRPPDIARADDPQGTREVVVEDAGVTFTAPRNWTDLAAAPPFLEGGVSSKLAVVAVWRYPRTEPLPAGRRELAQAQERLEARILERHPTFALRTSELTKIDDARAIEVTGRQEIGGRPYDVRSAHVFRDGAEVVVDAYAPPDDFARVDASVFVPLLASLKVSEPAS